MNARLGTLLLLLFAFLVVANPINAQLDDTPPDGNHQLRDLHIFADSKYGQWAGAGEGLEIETEKDSTLPIDTAVTPNDLPSYRVAITGEGGWWAIILAGKDWETYNLAPYLEEGVLQFNVRGAEGFEEFELTLSDTLRSSEIVAVSDYVQITDEWQAVQIPLTAFFPAGATIDLEQVASIDLATEYGGPQTFWLNDIKFSSTSSEPIMPPIKLNQLGYLPSAPKTALITGFDDQLTARVGTPFQVRSLATNEVAYAGQLELVTELDTAVSGERILKADFSPLNAPGDYFITIDAYRMEDSPLFTIHGDVYDNLLTDASRYFYLQRSGIPLEAEYAGQFARAIGHPQDANAEFRSGEFAPRDVAGGWYDAGDYGKYVNAGSWAISDLLWAYELFPNQFSDNQFNIPESNNDIPDLLDEIRWELDWILKMQDEESGGFYHMVQPTGETTIPADDVIRYIEDEDGNRTGVQPTSTTANAITALAHAAMLYEPFDADYAQQLLTAAQAGWDYLQDHPEGIAPVDGPYGYEDNVEDRFLAAAALYRATDEQTVHDYLAAVYTEVETLFESEDDNAYTSGMLGWLHYSKSDNTDPELMGFYEPLFTDWSNRMVERWNNSAWNLAMLDEDFYWGSNYVTLSTPFVMVIGAEALGQDTTSAEVLALNALDYLLGTNPLSFSYISGYGENSLQHPFSQHWSLDGIPAVPDGILAGGPNAYSNDLLYSKFAGKRYTDVDSAWTTNEHTIYWNSQLVFHAALAASLGENDEGEPMTVVIQPTATPLPSTPTPQPTEIAQVTETSVDENGVVAETSTAGETAVSANNAQQAQLVQIGQILTILAILIIILLIVIAIFLWRLLARKPN